MGQMYCLFNVVIFFLKQIVHRVDEGTHELKFSYSFVFESKVCGLNVMSLSNVHLEFGST